MRSRAAARTPRYMSAAWSCACVALAPRISRSRSRRSRRRQAARCNSARRSRPKSPSRCRARGVEGHEQPVEVMVEPDRGSEREEFAGDPGADSVERAGVVTFEPEAVFQSSEDRFDALADWREVWAVPGVGLVGGGAQQ